MTLERAIQILDRTKTNHLTMNICEYDEALAIAHEAIKEKMEREIPKPLTLDELRQINGQPVYVQKASFLESCYGIVCITCNQEYVMSFITVHQGYAMLKVHFSEYGESWIAYKYKPKEIE